MPYLARKRSWIKKITILLMTVLIVNPFVNILGFNSNIAEAAEGYDSLSPAPALALDEDSQNNNSDDTKQDDSLSLIDPLDMQSETDISEESLETMGTYNVNQPIVISKVFGGGSQNTDALYKYDFIELYNSSDAAVDLTGWSVQYAVSSSKSDTNSWQATPLSGSIPAKGYYLIQEAGKSTPYGPELTSPDEIGTIDLDNKDGKVALVADATLLNVVNPTVPAVPTLVDFVGYGGAKSYQGSGAAPTPSAQKAIVRKAQDPDNQAQGLVSTIGSASELYGNGWNSHNNSADFDIGALGTFAPHSSQTLTPLAVKVDSENHTITMDSLRDISATNNQFAVTMTTGTVKDGDLNATDYEVNGLPAGLTVSRAIGDSTHKKITFTISGTAVSDVTKNVDLTIVIRKSASTIGAYDDSRTVNGITLENNTPKVKGEVVSNALSMIEPTKANGSFSIHITTGTVKDGSLADTDYTLTGLPSGLTVQASGDSVTNTVLFTISGITHSPVNETIPLTVTLKASAVVSGASLDSDPITGVTLERYKKSVQADEARKEMLTERIKEANSYYSDSDVKSFKYGTSGMAATGAAFYRGAPYQMYQDLGTVIPLPSSWKNLTNVKTWIEGDAHVANVGYYDDKFGNIVFDLNDFDGSYIAPFYLDLLRMTSSLYLTRDADPDMLKNVSDADIRNMAKDMLNQYMLSLQSLVGNNDKNTSATKLDTKHVNDGFTKTVMNKLAKKSQLDHLIKWTVPTADGKHSTGVLNIAGKADKYRQPTAAERAEVELNWQKYVGTLAPDFVSAKLAENANYFTIKDVAVRIYQGLGSIGSQRYNVLIEGPTLSHDDDIILDVKQAFKPDMFENSDEAQTTPYDTFPGGDGARVKTAYEKLSLDAENFLGYLNSDTRTFFVHKISLFKGDYEDASGGAFKTKDNLADYVSYIAKAYAYAHARSAEYKDDTFERSVLEQVYNDSGAWNNFQTTLVNLGEDYYQQVKSDYNLMKPDLIAGKLIDVAKLNALSISTGTLSPAFDENKNSYTASVGSDVSSINVTASSLDSKATIKIKGVSYTNGTPKAISLATGSNVIDIVVTAQDGVTTKAYTVTITRQATSGGGDGNNGGGNNGNNGNNGNSGNGGNTGNNGNNSNNGSNNTGSGSGTTTKPKEESNEAELKKNTVVIDAAKMHSELSSLQASGHKEQNLIFNAPSTGNDMSLQLPLEVLEQTSKLMPSLVLTFHTGMADYNLPIQAINFTMLAKELGVPTATGTLTIHISHGAGKQENTLQASLKAADLNAVSAPIEFMVQAELNGKKVELKDFGNRYVSRVIPYESREKANQLVVVRFNTDGTLSVMPATFLNGKATMYSLSNSVYVVAHTQPKTFTDISKHWAKSEIELLAGKRIVQGTSIQSFSPDKTMTRAEFTVLLAKAFALNSNTLSGNFSDVSDSSWYSGAVGASYKAGIITGFTDGTFHPNQAITREQMAVMIVKAAELSGKSLNASQVSGAASHFQDASQISSYAQASVEVCRQAGIIKGNANGNFSPATPVTRAQAAVMFKQLLQVIEFMN